MRRLTLLVLVLVTGLGSPAFGQSEAPEGDGGLHVCCGGTIGSVGGSISGTVRGPGGGGGRSAPAPVVSNDTTAVTEGVVHKEPVKPQPVKAETTDDAPASSRSGTTTGPLLAALLVAATAAALFARRRPVDIS